ncbi:Rhodanese-like domain [Dillenia turbinata]|uniref:Rhodanese-like domain n=1 Tax=Dillenia turbinata TaxID=194707 RepID=A0AAN8W5C0_9MAGN
MAGIGWCAALASQSWYLDKTELGKWIYLIKLETSIEVSISKYVLRGEKSKMCFSNYSSSWLIYQKSQAGRMPGKNHHQRNLLVKAEVSYVNAEDAKKLVAVEGYSIVDVRDKSQFDRAHITSCYHVPLFIENKDNDLGTIIKRTVHNNFAGLFFGLAFTKTNPEFVQSVKSQFSPESKLLLVCQEGLRSAAAANKLDEAGFQNIACMTSGLQSVKPGMFDSVGSTELQNAGKAGLVTVQGKISAVLGTVLICAFLFITFFPEQAEKLFQLAPAS